MSDQLRLTWRDGVDVQVDGDRLRLTGGGRVQSLSGLPAPALELLLAMVPLDGADRGLTLQDCAPLMPLLDRLGHLLDLRIHGPQGLLASRQCTVRRWAPPALGALPAGRVRLSRFALIRSLGDRAVLECPLSTARWVLHSPLARELAVALASPSDVAALRSAGPEAEALVTAWTEDGLAEHVPGEADAGFSSDTDDALRMWDFHDLLMHSRTRSGRFDAPLGALSPHRGSLAPLAAEEPRAPAAVAGPRVALPRPSLTDLAAEDLPLQRVIEHRRSVREYDEEPVDIGQLGALLYRACRIRAAYTPPDGAGQESKISRPYPSGGGLYEHEFYLTVRRCRGLEAGVYRYDGRAHALVPLRAAGEDVAEMMNVALAAMGSAQAPDVLITLTSRFQRMSWRYSSIAYANSLRNTGAIYQTLYLVAHALGLAPCALGNGDADLSARVFGLDYLRESSVGDFALGRVQPAASVAGEPLPGWELLDVMSE